LTSAAFIRCALTKRSVASEANHENCARYYSNLPPLSSHKKLCAARWVAEDRHVSASANFAFASDNTAGISPVALAALQVANAGRMPSYGDDACTTEARQRFRDVFETDCDVFFVFNGTAANSLALAAICDRHHGILCHALSHIETDECGAPEFFTGGSKVIPLEAPLAKLRPSDLEPVLHRGHGVHFPKLRALSLTQSTELGTVYTPDEIRALTAFAHAHNFAVHMDGARFANACATLATREHTPADITWRAGVDVLCFGGTKNGLLTTEAVVFFDRQLAREFDYRVKQSGQLASKMRFASAQWAAVLREDAWLRQGENANRQAQALGNGLGALGFKLLAPVEANGVFVELPPSVFSALQARGWHFYKFIGDHGYRLMCSWDTREADVAAFLADARAAAAK
jgi:threonine aldolase